MTDYTRRFILILLLWICKIKLVSSSTPYCEFDLCSESEYCCRNNFCCSVPSESFHIVAWIMLGLLVVAIISGGLYKLKNHLYRCFLRESESTLLTAES